MILSIISALIGFALFIASVDSKYTNNRPILQFALILFGIISISFAMISYIIHDVNKVEAEEQKMREEFSIEIERYIENNDSVVIEDFIIRDLDVSDSKTLIAELIIEEKDEYYKVETAKVKESNSVDTPVVEYVKFEENLVYENKGDIYIISLTLPKGYNK